jgi:hypothetical protein
VVLDLATELQDVLDSPLIPGFSIGVDDLIGPPEE